MAFPKGFVEGVVLFVSFEMGCESFEFTKGKCREGKRLDQTEELVSLCE